MLFAWTAGLLTGETLSDLQVTVVAAGNIYVMTVECAWEVPHMSGLSEIVLRLPDQLPSGQAAVTVSLRGLKSNEVVINIR